MDKRWLNIRVELLGRRGETLQPHRAENFAIPPGCTFEEFGREIDLAFARWDLSHLRQFELEDGTLVVDNDMAAELSGSAFGGMIPRTSLLSTEVGRLLKVGSSFRYIFDLGDDRTHSCTVESQVDPVEVLGKIPSRPTAYFGWGTIPDQYGRQVDAENGVSEPHPLIDRTKFQIAVASGQAAEAIDAVSGVEIDTALQQVGAGLLKAYRAAKPAEQKLLSPVLRSVQQRLQRRGWEGDDLLQ